MPESHLTSPVLGPNLVIQRNQPLNLNWTGALGTPYEVMVFIQSITMDLIAGKIKNTTCYCRFPDTGSATIPTDVLSGLILPDPLFGSAWFSFSKFDWEMKEIGGIDGFKEAWMGEDSTIGLK